MPSSNKPIIRRASCYVANKDSGILSSLGLDYSVDRKVRGIPSNEVNKRILFKASNEYGEDEEYVRIIARDPVVPPVLSMEYEVVYPDGRKDLPHYVKIVGTPTQQIFKSYMLATNANRWAWSYRGMVERPSLTVTIHIAEGLEGGTWSLSGDRQIYLTSWGANSTYVYPNPYFDVGASCYFLSVNKSRKMPGSPVSIPSR